MIFAQGTNFGGYALYAPEGRLRYVYNFLGLESFVVEAPDPLPPGEHQVRMEFAYDGGGLGKGGTVSLFVDGEKVAEGRVERTHPVFFSVDASAMVGDKIGAPVAADLAVSGNRWSGGIESVRIDLDPKESGAVIPAEDLLRIALATQ